jgi:hypothetical protein
VREFEFLCACVRRFAGRSGPLPDCSDLDWPAVIDLAREHLILPVVARVLDDAGTAPAGLNASARTIARSNLALAAELLRLLEIFESAGVEAVPIKGPALAEQVYGDVGLRTFYDLDVLIRREDVLRTRGLLEARGYQLTSALHWNSPSAALRARDSQLTFEHPDRRVPIDVHWSLLPNYFPPALKAGDVWPNLRTAKFAGHTVLALAPEHLLLFLAVHAAKHQWERLQWICDIACLLRAKPELDRNLVLRQAAASGTARILSISLQLATELSCHRLAEGKPGAATTVQSVRFTWRTLDRKTDALKAVAGLFFLPTEAEYQALQLPVALYGVYFPFRLLRLCAKYAAGGLTSSPA